MNAPETETRILAILSDLSAVPAAEILREHRLREDLGLDSVSSMELVSMLSEELTIDIDLADAVRITDVAGLLSLGATRISDA